MYLLKIVYKLGNSTHASTIKIKSKTVIRRHENTVFWTLMGTFT